MRSVIGLSLRGEALPVGADPCQPQLPQQDRQGGFRRLEPQDGGQGGRHSSAGCVEECVAVTGGDGAAAGAVDPIADRACQATSAFGPLATRKLVHLMGC